MLDIETKRRIDEARDILVGKIPDPKSQVEQITIALIYKFMNDIDAESEELGGERTFFAGEFDKYRWANLVHSGLGGDEMLKLYTEALVRIPENPNIPPLFREIFNNVYLPYRDPETLRMFFNVIDDFTYDHSERLGDAFEHLLSVLGSQGDAGQFRTPRHIIDFMVKVIDPQKDERVMDPACGTAGFLVSSYKHIRDASSDDRGRSTLTPDEHARLVTNLVGYDISPDMVRLSLVNMYLHGFPQPNIHEYDTLTSEERWGEYSNVILANPPFMSPKGGIRPHNRFSVQSSRSEVLFVDYIAEHLTPDGRAAVIVPEGIIFQSQNAHTQLRKMLVEEYLVAVVSLPQGVFNPYSGVKTSILVMDKSLARRANQIAFFRVAHDGYDLGAQRRPVTENDLPTALEDINEYLRRVRTGEPLDEFCPATGLIVDKKRIAEGGEYNLSGERYRDTLHSNTAFPTTPIGSVCTVNPRKSEVAGLSPDTLISFVPMADLNENRIGFNPKDYKLLGQVGSSYTYFAEGDVLLAKVTPCFENGKAGIAKGLSNGIGFGSSEFYVLRSSEHILPEWLYFCITHPLFRRSGISQMTGTGGLQRLPRKFVEEFPIPLPPLEIQREIVAEIEGYQRVMDGARAVIENYRPHIYFDADFPESELETIAEVGSSKRILAKEYTSDGIPFYRTKEIVELDRGAAIGSELFISQDRFNSIRSKFGAPRMGDILVSAVGTIGTSWIVPDDRDFYFKDGNLLWIKDIKGAVPRYLKYCLDSVFERGVDNLVFGAAYKALTIRRLKKLKVPLPSLEDQRQIVTEIEAEQAIVDANRELVKRMEARIEATIGRVWETNPKA